jgi:hypothetical protein
LTDPHEGLQRAADAINEAASRHVANPKPLVRRAKLDPREVIEHQRAIRRCSVKWVAHQVKEEVVNDE